VKESDANLLIGLLNTRRSLRNDLIQFERLKWCEGVSIEFLSIPLELTENAFNYVKDTYITKIKIMINEIDDKLNSGFDIKMENE
jgi:hypothetical protein